MLIYSLIARDATILCECSDSLGNFATVTRLLLARISHSRKENIATAASSPGAISGSEDQFSMVSYMYDGSYAFHCLEDRGIPGAVLLPGNKAPAPLRFIVMADRQAGVRLPYRFLHESRKAFLEAYGMESPQHVVALAYSDTFGPTMAELMAKVNQWIDAGVDDASVELTPELVKVRKQIEAVQNIVVQNIDKIIARGEKIDLLVNRAESISNNTFEFRRQAQQLQRMMWWRQKRLVLLLAGGMLSIAGIFTSLEFGFPIPLR